MLSEVSTTRRVRLRVTFAGAVTTLLAIWVIFYVGWLWRTFDEPATRFLPHELALMSATVLLTIGWRSGRRVLVVFAVLALLFLFFEGTLFIPLGLAECQDWVWGGRLRYGAF